MTDRRLTVLVGTAALLALTACSPTTGAAGPVIGDPLPTTSVASPTTVAAAPATSATSATSATATEDAPAPARPDGAGAATDCGPESISASTVDLEPAASGRSLLLLLQNTTPTTDCALTNPPDLLLLDGAAPLPTDPTYGALPEGRPGPAESIPAEFGVTVAVAWRVVPSSADADPATDCVAASAIRVRLTPTAPPIEVPVNLTACGRGALDVTPYDINAG